MRYTASEILTGDLEHTSDEEATAAVDEPQPPTVVHTVALQGVLQSNLRLSRAKELPAGMLERILGSADDRETTRAIRTGLTARVVRWDATRYTHSFNGRIGTPLTQVQAGDEVALLAMALFPRLTGLNEERHQTVLDSSESVKHWKFASGDQPSVSQWLAGMGEVIPDEEAAPEVPRETMKLLAAEQHHAIGRVRVPKGGADLSTDADDEDDSDDGHRTATRADFSQLLAGASRGPRAAGSDSGSATSEDSVGSDGGPRLFSSLFERSENRRPQSATLSPNAVQQATSAMNSVEGGVEDFRSTTLATPEVPESTVQQVEGQESDGLQSYGKAFAAVDKVGLTADAASQARWEHDHPASRQRKRHGAVKVRPSQPLSPRPTAGSVPMSLSTGRELPRLQPLPTPLSMTSQASTQSTIRGYSDTVFNEEPWARRVVHGYSQSGMLVDVSAPQVQSSRRPPPALLPSTNGATSQKSHSTGLPAIKKAQVDASPPGDLIDLSESNVPTHTVTAPKSASTRPMAPFESTMYTEGQSSRDSLLDDDFIPERLQPEPERAKKHFTMRQKANKKGKHVGGKGKTSTIKVELPKPDPVPASGQPSKRQQRAALQQSRPAMESPAALPPNFTPIIVSEDTPSISKACEPYEALLEHARATSGTHLEVQFGMILSRLTDDKDLKKTTFTAQQLEERLNATAASEIETVFLQRLTTSTKDAKHIMDCQAARPLPALASYEIELLDASKRRFIVKATSDALLDINAKYLDGDVTETRYLHFPVHVWDACCRLIKSEEVPGHRYLPLVNSLQTDGEVPSLLTRVSDNTLLPQRVLAKREYSRTIANGITLLVTQVQELFLETTNCPEGYDIRAICLDSETMVEQHRLWWEAKLVVDAMAVSEAEMLKVVVEDMVAHIDGVGFGNIGPWEKHRETEEEIAKRTMEPEIPFW